jgi:hypothetical protein
MKKSLFNFKDYGVFTFVSTSQALKAERVLKDASADFLTIPTPREISTSCGLAVKIACGDLRSCWETLVNNKVQIDGAYLVKKVDGIAQMERLNDE